MILAGLQSSGGAWRMIFMRMPDHVTGCSAEFSLAIFYVNILYCIDRQADEVIPIEYCIEVTQVASVGKKGPSSRRKPGRRLNLDS